jgi:biotin operon repressor
VAKKSKALSEQLKTFIKEEGLSYKEVCRLINCSRQTLWRWFSSGIIPQGKSTKVRALIKSDNIGFFNLKNSLSLVLSSDCSPKETMLFYTNLIYYFINNGFKFGTQYNNLYGNTVLSFLFFSIPQQVEVVLSILLDGDNSSYGINAKTATGVSFNLKPKTTMSSQTIKEAIKILKKQGL